MNRNHSSGSKGRLILLIVCVVVVFVAAVFMLMQYQIVDGADYAKQATKNNQSTIPVEAARGEITDRYGRPLVTNQLSLNVVINKTDISDEQLNQVILDLIHLFQQHGTGWIDQFPISMEQPYTFLEGQDGQVANLKSALKAQDYATAQNCMDLLVSQCKINGYSEQDTRLIAGVRGQMLMENFSEQTPYVFAENVDNAFASTILELSDSLPGVSVTETYNRFYPDGTIAPHILGTVGPIYQEEYANYKDKGYPMDAIVGKSGIEYAYEDALHGTDGKMTVVKDDNGQIVDQYYKEGDEPKPGNTVMLTIDKQFQKDVQDALASFILSLRRSSYPGAKGGAVAVLDVDTGEALALATYPSYDINEYNTNYNQLASDTVMKPLFNRTLMGTYRPGSTFKTCVAVAGLTEGVINENTYFNCVNPFVYYGQPFNCLQNHHHGPTNIYTALQYSCNIYFYNTGDRLGIDKMNEYAHAMGLGVDTGLEIAAETGHISSPEYFEENGLRWEQGYVIQTAIGQSETMVTPLQMASLVMTIANHGVRYETHLIQSIEKYDYSATVSETQPVVASTLPDKNRAYDITTEGMKRMASTVSVLRGMDVAAKSGTPEFYQNGVYKTNSAAVCFYPASDPEIAIGIMLEEGGNAPNLIKPIIDAYEASKTQQVETPVQSNQLIVQ